MIVPDMLGYGATDMPHDSSAYSTKNICNDISALLDFLDIPKAVRWSRSSFLDMLNLGGIGRDWP